MEKTSASLLYSEEEAGESQYEETEIEEKVEPPEEEEDELPVSEMDESKSMASIESPIPPDIAGQIRKNLNKKKQRRPKAEHLNVTRADKTPSAAPLQALNLTLTNEDNTSQEDGNRRKSLLEYLKGDMVEVGQKAPLFRFVAIGSHQEDPEELMKLHEKIIEVINTACYDEPATGYLVVYPSHFTHILEGSEMTINKYIAICAELFQGHIQDCLETDYHARPDKSYTVRMVILNFVVVRERYTTEWYHVVHLNPSHRGLMKHAHGYRRKLFEFIKGIWILSGVLADSYAKETKPFSEDPVEAAMELAAEKDIYRKIQEKLYALYPGTDALNYFLKEKKRVPPLRTPEEHIKKFWTVPNIILDAETTWPIPCRLAPYH